GGQRQRRREERGRDVAVDARREDRRAGGGGGEVAAVVVHVAGGRDEVHGGWQGARLRRDGTRGAGRDVDAAVGEEKHGGAIGDGGAIDARQGDGDGDVERRGGGIEVVRLDAEAVRGRDHGGNAVGEAERVVGGAGPIENEQVVRARRHVRGEGVDGGVAAAEGIGEVLAGVALGAGGDG